MSCLIKPKRLKTHTHTRRMFFFTLLSRCGLNFFFTVRVTVGVNLRIIEIFVWTKGTDSLRLCICPRSPSLPLTHLHPPFNTTMLFLFPPVHAALLPSVHSLDIHRLSPSFATFPYPISPCITLHRCISCCCCSAPTQSHYISALTHSLSLSSIQTSHFSSPLHLVPLSSQSSTSVLTLIPTGPGERDVNISFERSLAQTHTDTGVFF